MKEIRAYKALLKTLGVSDEQLILMLNEPERVIEMKMDYLWSCLTPRQIECLELRFGFKDSICHTLEEIGKHFNVTRERIRQIIASAIHRIRYSTCYNILLYGELVFCRSCGKKCLFSRDGDICTCKDCFTM